MVDAVVRVNLPGGFCRVTPPNILATAGILYHESELGPA